MLTDAGERCFGRPETIGPLADCLRETGGRLLTMKAEVVREIERLVPLQWEGRAAEAFNAYMDTQIDAVLRMADGALITGGAMGKLETGMAAAKQRFNAAEMEAVAFDLRIDYVEGVFLVEPWGRATPDSLAAIPRVLAEVNQAKAMADAARAAAMTRLEIWSNAVDAIFSALLDVFTGPGGRSAPTGGPGPRPPIPPAPRPPAPTAPRPAAPAAPSVPPPAAVPAPPVSRPPAAPPPPPPPPTRPVPPAALRGGPPYDHNMVENPGPLAGAPGNPAGAFAGGKYNVVTLSDDTILYRAGAAGGGRNAFGQWFSSVPAQSEAQARIDYAVKPQWIDPNTGALTGQSPIQSVYAIKIPAGTQVYVGPTSYQDGVYVGGATQIYVPQPWAIPGVKVLSETPLP
jgi:hypothetical protein